MFYTIKTDQLTQLADGCYNVQALGKILTVNSSALEGLRLQVRQEAQSIVLLPNNIQVEKSFAKKALKPWSNNHRLVWVNVSVLLSLDTIARVKFYNGYETLVPQFRLFSREQTWLAMFVIQHGFENKGCLASFIDNSGRNFLIPYEYCIFQNPLTLCL